MWMRKMSPSSQGSTGMTSRSQAVGRLKNLWSKSPEPGGNESQFLQGSLNLRRSRIITLQPFLRDPLRPLRASAWLLLPFQQERGWRGTTMAMGFVRTSVWLSWILPSDRVEIWYKFQRMAGSCSYTSLSSLVPVFHFPQGLLNVFLEM